MEEKLNGADDDALAVANSVGAVPDQVSAQPGGDDDALAVAQSLGAVPVQGSPDTPPEAEHENDFGAAALRGLKQTLAPHALTKDDIKGDHSKLEMATEFGTSLASDVAMGAAIGSIVPGAGTGVGAVLAPVAMALYRGFGYEKARSAAEGGEFNVGRGLLNSITELNPLMHAGGRLAKAGSQAALEAGKEYAYSQDANSAVFSGALGGLFGAAFHREGPGWLAMMGDLAVKPGSQTKHLGLDKGTVETMAEALKHKPGSLGERVENDVKRMQETDPNYFNLGDKLEQAKQVPEITDDMGNVVKQPRKRGAPEQDEFGNRIESVAADIDGFKSWRVGLDGRRMGDRDVDAEFEHYLNTQGKMKTEGSDFTTVEKDYAVYKAQQLLVKSVEAQNVAYEKGITGVEKIKDPTHGGLADKVRDMKFQMRMIDDATGGALNLEGAADEFVKAKNKQSIVMSTFLDKADKITREARNVKLDNDTIGRWLAAEPGKEHLAPQLNDKQLAVAEKWRDLWEEARTELKNQGLDIDFIGTGATYSKGFNPDGSFKTVEPREDGWRRYLPLASKRGADLKTSLRREMTRLEAMHGADFMQTKDASGLREVVGHILGEEPNAVLTRNKVRDAMDSALEPRGKKMAGYEAGAAFQRDPGGNIPDFKDVNVRGEQLANSARDYDVGNLFVGYLNTNFKAALYHDAFTQMGANVQIMKSMGMDKSAEYLEKYIAHLSGPSDKMASMQSKIAKHTAAMEEMIDGVMGDGIGDNVKRNAMKAYRDAPRAVGFLIGQLYPNVLGFNVKATLRNYAQPLLTTAPELGWGYGSRLVGKAMSETAGDWVKAKGSFDKALVKPLQAKNLAPGEHFGDAKDISGKSLRTTKLFGPGIELLDKVNGAGMWAYGMSDNVNRTVTFKVGHQLAKDFAAGQKNAVDYVRRVASEGNKQAIRKIIGGKVSIDEADIGKLGDELATQLIGKTQFNYGKESMNEFGREYGRLVSMMSKWPVMIMSDTDEIFRKNKLAPATLKILQRYMAPSIALAAMGSMVLDTKDNPKMAYLVGKDFADAAPMGSLTLSAPPVVGTAAKTLETLHDMVGSEFSTSQKAEKAWKLAKDTALTYTPGTSFINEGSKIKKAFIDQ